MSNKASVYVTGTAAMEAVGKTSASTPTTGRPSLATQSVYMDGPTVPSSNMASMSTPSPPAPVNNSAQQASVYINGPTVPSDNASIVGIPSNVLLAQSMVASQHNKASGQAMDTIQYGTASTPPPPALADNAGPQASVYMS